MMYSSGSYERSRAVVFGHSIARNLETLVNNADRQRRRPTGGQTSLRVSDKVEVLFRTRGGKQLTDVKSRDIELIGSLKPDIIVVMLGENDVFF